MPVVQVVGEVAAMVGTIIEVSHLMNKPPVEATPIISIGHQWTVVPTEVAMSMGVVEEEEEAGLVLDGTTAGGTVLITQKMNAGTAELTPDGHYPVLVRTQYLVVISCHQASLLVNNALMC